MLAILSVALVVPEDALARRSGGGFSSGGSRSSSSNSNSRSNSWSSKRPSSDTARAPSSTQKTTTPTRSAADQKAYAAAKKSGTAYQSKSQAQDAFKTKHASQYKQTPTPGSSEPAKRPAHIPGTTSGADGATYNVTYNVERGGYGYMSSGRWVMYDALADAAMLSVLMGQRGYYYPGVAGTQGTVQTSAGAGTILLIIGIVFIVLLVIGAGVAAATR